MRYVGALRRCSIGRFLFRLGLARPFWERLACNRILQPNSRLPSPIRRYHKSPPRSRFSFGFKRKNFTTKLPRTTLGTGLAPGTNTEQKQLECGKFTENAVLTQISSAAPLVGVGLQRSLKSVKMTRRAIARSDITAGVKNESEGAELAHKWVPRGQDPLSNV